jgi:hypothetical protein
MMCLVNYFRYFPTIFPEALREGNVNTQSDLVDFGAKKYPRRLKYKARSHSEYTECGQCFESGCLTLKYFILFLRAI